MTDKAVDRDSAALETALRKIDFLAGLSEDVMRALTERLTVDPLAAGTALFNEGEASDDIYIVKSGAVAIARMDDDNNLYQVGTIYAGDTVGEMAMLTGEPRSATAIAIRDCELFRLSRAVFEELIASNAVATIAIARVLAKRLARIQPPRQARGRPKVFAFRAITPMHDAQIAEIIANLCQYIVPATSVCTVAHPWRGDWRECLQDLEAQHEFVFLQSCANRPEWNAYCCRQADVVVHLAEAERGLQDVFCNDILREKSGKPNAHNELIVLSRSQALPTGSAQWISDTGIQNIHHMRDAMDARRIVRLLTRRSLAIVLSGGGARSFAHLGVLQALNEAGIMPDIYGGTSMGAVIAAAYAAGFPADKIRDDIRRVFLEGRPLSDPTFPIVSLFRGGKIDRLLTQAFADIAIEDLRHPFFCLSSDISNAVPVIHRQGPLRKWLRATITIPGIFPPVLSNGVVLVDGGVIDNLPIGAAHEMGRGTVIGVDVSGDEDTFAPPIDKPISWWQRVSGARRPGEPDIVETLWRVGTIGSIASLRRGAQAAQLIIRPPVARIPLLDWKRFDETVSIGYEHTKSLITERQALFDQWHAQ